MRKKTTTFHAKLIYISFFFAPILVFLIVMIMLSDGFAAYLSYQKKINPNILDGQYNDRAGYAIFNNEDVKVPEKKQTVIVQNSPSANESVLGEKDSLKFIFIDLKKQRLYAYEGNSLKYNFAVSTGKWNRTPTGKFKIWIKLRYTLMEGGSRELGTYYYLPNVPYTMYFYNQDYPQTDGYGIHGAYWHNNFGNPMSHGCINMKEADVKQLYYWANPALGKKESIKASDKNKGTEIIIYGKAPEI